MTIDTTELKKAAESCDVNKCADEAEWDRRFSEFLSECDPDVTLALLAEIGRLEADNRSLRGSCAKVGSENSGLTRQLKRATRQSADARAELAGLRTGYDAQNQVIADLRKDAERYRWLRDKQTFIWLIQDWFPGAEFTDVNAEIDAAMAKEARQ